MSLLRTIAFIGLALALAANSSAQQPAKAKPSFQTTAKKYFSAWDKDKNGELSLEELDRVLNNPSVKGEPAAVAAVLRQAATPKKKADPVPNITMAYLGAPESGSLDSKLASAMDRIAKADRKLFVGDGPKLDTIHQGGIGDCFALAPLGAFVARDPKAVARMMTELPNGGVRVQFASRAVEVAPLTDGEYAMAGGSSEHSGSWVRVYEKAVGQYRHEMKGEQKSKEVATDIIAHGGNMKSILAMLTGHAAVYLPTNKLQDTTLDSAKRNSIMADLREKLKTSVAEKRLMGISTPPKVVVPGLTPQHAYAVLGYDSKTDVLTIWNPHGNTFMPKGPEGLENGYAKKDGLFKAPLKEAVQWADGLVFETDKAPPPPKK